MKPLKFLPQGLATMALTLLLMLGTSPRAAAAQLSDLGTATTLNGYDAIKLKSDWANGGKVVIPLDVVTNFHGGKRVIKSASFAQWLVENGYVYAICIVKNTKNGSYGKDKKITSSSGYPVPSSENWVNVICPTHSGGKGYKDLTTLDLSGRGISNMGEGLGYFANLTDLNLSNNNISSIGQLNKLTNLTSLNLSNNKLSSIGSINKLTKLTTLDLSNNSLTELSGLEGMSALNYINLSNNPKLGTDVWNSCGIPNGGSGSHDALVTCLLSNCGFTTQPSTQRLTGVQWFDLSRNKFSVFDPTQTQTKGANRASVISFNLSGNTALTTVQNVTMTSCTTLNLSGCTSLKTLSGCNMPRLTSLDMTNVTICKDFSNNIFGFSSLNLQGKGVRTFKGNKLNNLTYLRLSNVDEVSGNTMGVSGQNLEVRFSPDGEGNGNKGASFNSNTLNCYSLKFSDGKMYQMDKNTFANCQVLRCDGRSLQTFDGNTGNLRFISLERNSLTEVNFDNFASVAQYISLNHNHNFRTITLKKPATQLKVLRLADCSIGFNNDKNDAYMSSFNVKVPWGGEKFAEDVCNVYNGNYSSRPTDVTTKPLFPNLQMLECYGGWIAKVRMVDRDDNGNLQVYFPKLQVLHFYKKGSTGSLDDNQKGWGPWVRYCPLRGLDDLKEVVLCNMYLNNLNVSSSHLGEAVNIQVTNSSGNAIWSYQTSANSGRNSGAGANGTYGIGQNNGSMGNETESGISGGVTQVDLHNNTRYIWCDLVSWKDRNYSGDVWNYIWTIRLSGNGGNSKNPQNLLSNKSNWWTRCEYVKTLNSKGTVTNNTRRAEDHEVGPGKKGEKK